MSTRIATVFGATGTQGESVVDHLLTNGTFKVRAVTRDTESEKALALKARGVEVVKADLGDLQSLIPALEGTECVYAVTKPYQPNNKLNEFEMGKNIVDASKQVGVKFLIWSSLPNATELSKGKYTGVHHFDQKSQVDKYLAASGLPHAIIMTGWFYENAWNMDTLVKKDTGYDLIAPIFPPDAPQVFTWVAKEIGSAVVLLFTQYASRAEEILGQTFIVANARMSYSQLAKLYSQGLGAPVNLVTLPSLGFPPLDDMLRTESEFGIFNEHQSFPDPKLVKLGMKTYPIEDFLPILKARM